MKSFLKFLNFLIFFYLLLVVLPFKVKAQSLTLKEVNEFAQKAQEIAQKFGNKIAAYEIWNEEDQGGSSAVELSDNDYNLLLDATCSKIKAVSSSKVIVGGLVSGQPSYLSTVNLGCVDGIGLHPYAQYTPEGLNSILERYEPYGKPLWITEFGWENPDEQQQAEYLKMTFNVFNSKNNVPAAVWYCWSDGMNPGFGLITTSGKTKQSYHSFPRNEKSGVNIDPANPYGNPSAEQIKILGAQWVRMVYKRDYDNDPAFDQLIEEYSSQGIKIILVLNQETLWIGGKVAKRGEVNLDIPSKVKAKRRFTPQYEFQEKISSDEPESNLPPSGTTIFSQIIRSLSGNIFLSSIKLITFPAFNQMVKNYTSAFSKLLPDERYKNSSLAGEETLLYTTTHAFRLLLNGNSWVVDTSEKPKCLAGAPQPEAEDVAKTKGVIPYWWSNFVSAIVGTRGMLFPSSRLAKAKHLPFYESFIYALGQKDNSWDCEIYNIFGGYSAKNEKTKPPENTQPSFDVSIIDYLRKIYDIPNRIINVLLRRGIEFKMNSQLAGGLLAKTTAIEEGGSFVSQKNFKKLPKWGDLVGEITTEVALSPGVEETNPLFFGDQQPTRAHSCAVLCSVTPEKRTKDNSQEWIGEDKSQKICPSCNFEDYKTNFAFPTDLSQEWCHNNGTCCDYYKDNSSHGCPPEGDPVCESGLCNPLEIWPKELYGNCEPPYQADNCNLPEVCVPVTFAPSPDGFGYGPCHYCNPTVCVRADIADIGSCAAVCNWQCCAALEPQEQ